MESGDSPQPMLSPAKLCLLRTLREPEGTAPQGIPCRAASGPVEVADVQRGMWFLDRHLGPGAAPAYNLYVALRLRGPLDVPQLTEALTTIVRRHEPLRTTFQEKPDGRVMQVVTAPAPVRLPVCDLREFPPEQRLDKVSELAVREGQRPFSLSRGPLFRPVLFRLDEQDHGLLLSFHHIVADGWSIGVLYKELGALYAGEALPELRLQYSDVTEWRRGQRRGGVQQGQIDYWRERLAGAPGVLHLPWDRPRPVEPSSRGDEVGFRLHAEMRSRLWELSRGERASLFTVLLAAFQVLLSRWSGERDVCIGVPVSGRTRGELEPLIGLFLNTLVLRSDLSGNPTFRELLRRTRQSALEAYANQDVPFERIVEELRPERHSSHNPLFQVVLNGFSEVSVPRLTGLDVEPLRLGNSFAKFDLTLDLEDDPHGIRGVFTYSTDLFDRVSVVALADRFRLVLGQVVGNPDVRVGDVDVVLGEERLRLGGFNDSSRLVEEVSLAELVARRVGSCPDAVALCCEGVSLSFAELEARANRLAWRLSAVGAGPERLVGVMVPRSAELVVALLAVVKSGAAWLPLDPDYPAERLAFMVSDSAPVAVVTVDSLVGSVPAGVGVVMLDESVVRGDPVTAPPVPVNVDAPAYVIYTSGSTGRPKGAVVSHRSIVNRLLWMQDQYGLEPEDRVLQKTPSSFDVSVWEFFWPLIAGAGLVVARPGGHRDTAYIASLVRSERVTTAHFVPSMLRVFLDDPGAPACRSLRRVICSGEVLPDQVVSRFAEVLPDTELHNLYGPTEAAIDVTAERCSPAAPVTIGRPLWNTRAHVLDSALRQVPIGASGQLYLAGVQLARGYVNRPGLTAQCFVPDPYGPPGSRMYRTGDIARWTRDGRLEYLGRLDDQVKIRGARIELGEVEAALALHPQISAAVVTAREDRPGDKRLVGYVVTPATTDLDQIRHHASTLLPDYMIPSTLVRLQQFPLTANDKINRNALPPPQPRSTVDIDLPATHRERVLAELFAAVLGLPRVGVQDSFFALGGDSILALQLVSRARGAGLQLTSRQVFTYKTVRALAATAGEVRDEVAAPDDVAVGPVTPTPVMRSWLERGGPLDGYGQSALLQVPADADTERLGEALQALLDTHDVLRARLERQTDGDWALRIVPPASVSARSRLRRVDLSNEEDDAVAASIAAESESAFARLRPQSGVMVQAVWFDLGPQRQGRLLIALHHMVVDGVSWRILLQDLAEASRTGRVRSSGTSFRRWARILLEEAARPGRVAELPLWAEMLSPTAPLPLDRPPAPGDTAAILRDLTINLPPDWTEPLLTTVPASVNGNVNDVLLTALTLAVRPWRGGADRSVVVELEGHGREEIAEVDLARTVGWFTSAYPVRFDPGIVDWADVEEGGDALGEVLKRVKEQLRAVPDHGLGYGLLRYLNSHTSTILRDLPIPPISFNYLGRFSLSDPPGADWAVAPDGPPLSGAIHPDTPVSRPLEIAAVVQDGQKGPTLHVTFTWPDGVLTEKSVRQLADEWCAALDGLTRYSARQGAGGLTPSDLSLTSLSQAEIEMFEDELADMLAEDDVP